MSSTLAALPSATSISNSDVLYIEQSGVAKKTSVGLLPSGGGGGTAIATLTRTPTKTDDNTAGFAANQMLFNTATHELWIAYSVATGAAVWVPVDPSRPAYVASNTYLPYGLNAKLDGSLTGTVPSGTMVMFFGRIHSRMTISQLGAQSSSGTNATYTTQLGIYQVDPVTRKPGALMGNTGDMNFNASGRVFANMAATTQLEPGLYGWATMVASAGSPTFAITNTADSLQNQIVGCATNTDALGPAAGLKTSVTYGTWPSSLSGTNMATVYSGVPIIAFTIGSLP